MASIDEIWLLDFGDPYPDEPAARRPGLILGPPPRFGPSFPYVVVAPLTSTRRSLSIHVEIEATPASGLSRTSYVQCELLRSVSTRRLLHRIGTIDQEASRVVKKMVSLLLGW
jgi:mRNA interferase MazF